MSIVIASDLSLSRDIDVRVNVSKPQAELTTDLSVSVFVTPDAPFDHDANRIRFYTSLDAVAGDFASSSEAYKAATAFFSQSPRSLRFAIGKVFETPVSGFLKMGSVDKVLTNWTGITDGSFQVSIDGISKDVTGIDFTGASDMDAVASILQAKLGVASAGTTVVNLGSGVFKIVSGTTGESSTVSFLDAVTPATGTDISELLGGRYNTDSEVQTAYAVPGYTPGNLASEVALISEAATCSSRFVYGWTLDKKYRDDSDAVDVAEWIEANTALLALCVNSAFAYDSGSASDVGSLVNAAGYTRTFVVYHNNPYYYPEVAILARALSVNYAAPDSTITTKFKDLNGIPTVPITQTQLEVLNGKRINTFTAVGNNARTFREGVNASPSWFIDDRINLDNFREELQVAVYNVFLQRKKIPYTTNGLNLLRSAMDRICNRYVINGTFAERPVDQTEYDKPAIEPAYLISFAGIGSMTVSDRNQRVGPPATIIVNMAGAIHSISIAVEAYS